MLGIRPMQVDTGHPSEGSLNSCPMGDSFEYD